MLRKLFVLGCSGSGKSTAARYINMLVRDIGWSAIHISDYRILYDMFQNDTAGKRFRRVAYDGFDVLDPYVYDKALLQIEREVLCLHSKANGLILIEFARDDYGKALKLFGDGFLRDAYFLLLDCDPDICIQRIRLRAICPRTSDDHFVPEHIVKTYRRKENRSYITLSLKKDFAIDDQYIEVIDNIGSCNEFGEKLKHFVENKLTCILAYQGKH